LSDLEEIKGNEPECTFIAKLSAGDVLNSRVYYDKGETAKMLYCFDHIDFIMEQLAK